MNSDESKPLLSASGVPSVQVSEPPPYEEPARLAPYGLSPEEPPPYSSGEPISTARTSGPNQTMFVQCRVCQSIIHVASGKVSRVVKCSSCNEATPVAPPPDGKKYVRCPCNCLLTCSENATRVVCPRINCKRTIGVGTISVRPTNMMDRIRVVCGRCHKAILWPSNASVAKCPHCRTKSYLYVNWMRYRAFSCLSVGIFLIILSIILFASTFIWAERHGGIFVLWFGGIFFGVCFLIRSGFYFAMTKSHMER